MTEATQTGAEEVQATLNPRNAALEQIAGNVEEQKKEEFAPIETGAEPETPKEEPKEEEPKPAEPPAEEPPAEEPQEKLITLKVDGKEIQVPESKIYEAGRRTLQKEVAADKRLEEATRLLREAETRAKQPPKQDVAQTTQQTDAEILAQALTSGDPRLATAAIEELMKAGRQPTIQPQEIFGLVQQMTVQELEAKTAQQQFMSEFPEVVQDPFLLRLAIDLEDQRLARVQQGLEPVIPLTEAFKNHGEALRKWKGISAPSQTLAEKAERKATVQTLPSAKAKAPAPDKDKPESTEDIINQMRRARRQIK